MTPKTFSLVEKCIEDGLALAKNRIEKNEVDPDSEIADCMRHDAIMSEIDEWFDFDVEHLTLTIQSAEHQ